MKNQVNAPIWASAASFLDTIALPPESLCYKKLEVLPG